MVATDEPADPSTADLLDKVRATKRAHDQLMLDRISHHFREQLDTRLARQGHTYAAAIQDSLAGVQDVFDRARAHRLLAPIAAGQWAEWDQFLWDEALPQNWLDSPRLRAQVLSALIKYKAPARVVALVSTLRGRRVALDDDTYYRALGAALQLPEDPDHQEARAFYRTIQTDEVRPTRPWHVACRLDYFLATEEPTAAQAEWQEALQSGLATAMVYLQLLRGLDALVCNATPLPLSTMLIRFPVDWAAVFRSDGGGPYLPTDPPPVPLSVGRDVALGVVKSLLHRGYVTEAHHLLTWVLHHVVDRQNPPAAATPNLTAVMAQLANALVARDLTVATTQLAAWYASLGLAPPFALAGRNHRSEPAETGPAGKGGARKSRQSKHQRSAFTLLDFLRPH
ncbi:hypothetical protein IWQ60_011832 [Tieghemiomyces parasiticus]|uniref:Uncharacterized protein n=1 Tax=Tieghemiomyces parasiticus TaxID=78921 RepID=A0A9W8DI35_9FUNG|nr:hypothetical protein IWQ60_011832 [Tieghemiomyces parasiticus]